LKVLTSAEACKSAIHAAHHKKFARGLAALVAEFLVLIYR
jgi:hypothetical protein